MEAYTAKYLRADCLETRISSERNARIECETVFLPLPVLIFVVY